jgi:hypothetical protein
VANVQQSVVIDLDDTLLPASRTWGELFFSKYLHDNLSSEDFRQRTEYKVEDFCKRFSLSVNDFYEILAHEDFYKDVDFNPVMLEIINSLQLLVAKNINIQIIFLTHFVDLNYAIERRKKELIENLMNNLAVKIKYKYISIHYSKSKVDELVNLNILDIDSFYDDSLRNVVDFLTSDKIRVKNIYVPEMNYNNFTDEILYLAKLKGIRLKRFSAI